MSFTLADVTFLASPLGAALLERLAAADLSDANTLKLVTQLRKDHTAEQSRAVLELARLRLKATAKFGDDARRMFFTRAALEQASDPQSRRHRAERVAANSASVVDVGCGIGGDALAFAAAGLAVVGLDIDPVRVELARLNAAALGRQGTARFEVADARAGLPDADAAFFDPARRDERGSRIFDVERYTPPLSTSRGWPHRLIVVKLSPGVELVQLGGYGGRQVEFVSVDGNLKEAVLWLGTGFTGLRATLLTGGETLHWDNISPPLHAMERGSGGEVATPRAWLVEPDPAIIRAGLVQDAAAHFGGAQLDDTIAYFTTDDHPNSPWVRAWRVLDWLPFNLKQLRAYLNAHDVGSVTIKKRGTAVTPEELTAKLKLKGKETRTLVLTRCRGEQIVIVCADIQSGNTLPTEPPA